ncbi:hypothetical protein [Treponema pectinovorum]|uniref:hypothetical protein n=1 Tax=Treponema pectinovorum TaxID=164 RepID=UPI0011C7197A|nr:hypothetical protein [Treponema pectinovorum]
METKLKSNLTNLEVIEYIQKDMTFNKKIKFLDMIEYLKSELRIYFKTADIDETEDEYKNRFDQILRLNTLQCKDLKVIIREKINGDAEVKFEPL